MILTKITINDFGVYRGRNQFDFQTDSEKPIVLCGGTNGSGKTTLFESVMLCLYGKKSYENKVTEKQYNDNILRTIHRYLGTKKSAEEASITVEFQFAHDGKVIEYQVLRMWQNNNGKIDETLSVKKKSPSDEEYGDLDLVEESQWQAFIDHLIPKGIAKLFFFDGEKIQDIADEGKEDIQIKTSFDTLLGLDLVNQLNDDIGIFLVRESKDNSNKIKTELDEDQATKEKLEKINEQLASEIAHIEQDIARVNQKRQVLEDKLKKLGGEFSHKRDLLQLKKTEEQYNLTNIEKSIKELCSGNLPFSLIPKQMAELKEGIIQDQKIIQNSFAKDILEKNFAELLSEIKSENFVSKIDSNSKKHMVKQIETYLNDKVKSVSNNQKTKYNISSNDMVKIIQLIDSVKDTSEIESLTKSFNVTIDSLEKLKISLDHAPKDDVIGPILSDIREADTELKYLEEDVEKKELAIASNKYTIVKANTRIRNNLSKKRDESKLESGLNLAPKVQDVLDEYSDLLRNKKLELLEKYILNGLKMLLHKKDFIEKVTIDNETFEVKLFKGNDDEITKSMLSKGELQMFATAVVWALAKTSGRPLPFMIDTPLARLDEEHRESVVENFYPEASHQTIIFSTDSEINYNYYKKLEPYLQRSFVIHYDSNSGKTKKLDRYFFDKNGEKIIEI